MMAKVRTELLDVQAHSFFRLPPEERAAVVEARNLADLTEVWTKRADEALASGKAYDTAA